MKLGHIILIEYYKRNVLLKNYAQNVNVNLAPDPFIRGIIDKNQAIGISQSSIAKIF